MPRYCGYKPKKSKEPENKFYREYEILDHDDAFLFYGKHTALSADNLPLYQLLASVVQLA